MSRYTSEIWMMPHVQPPGFHGTRYDIDATKSAIVFRDSQIYE